MDMQFSMDDILIDSKEDTAIENLVNRYKFAEDNFRQAIEAFEKFKQENPLYNQAKIKRVCYCERIRFVVNDATRLFLHPHNGYSSDPLNGWLSCLGNVCTEYSFEEGTLIGVEDKQLYDELEQEMIRELDNLRNQLKPLIVSAQKRIYSIGLRKAELSTELTKEVLDKEAHHEQCVDKSYSELLVIQQLISDKLLKDLQFDTLPVGKRDNIPSNLSGVYLLWKHGELDYIGQSSAIRERLSGHHVFDKELHLVTVVPIEDDEERKGIEKWLIKKLNPERNITYSYQPLNQTADSLGELTS